MSELLNETDTKKFVEDIEVFLRQKSVKDEVWNSTAPAYCFENGLGQKLEIRIFSNAIGGPNGAGYGVEVWRHNGEELYSILWLSDKDLLMQGLKLIKEYASTYWKTVSAGAA